MARYIDADKVMDEINRIGGHNLCEWETIGVKALIDRQPTADVVPKSEVEKLERTVKYLEGVCESLPDKVKAEVSREIFEEIERVMSSLDRRYMASENPKQSWGVRGAMTEIAELKKKYTKQSGE